ncbi:hypothetical protein FA13DRAFT_1796562 [Coprinellus micaceus]|uniref:Uncharacterized protein n=1 Tax=Coprinellus micaceus TaxID=71717 RepID=A0A4Y7STV4_COPMI|nr:hypothetical protein FA13DRAFT_1796562 [Coprinellus micaceus]
MPLHEHSLLPFLSPGQNEALLPLGDDSEERFSEYVASRTKPESHCRTAQTTHSSAQDGMLIASQYSVGRQLSIPDESPYEDPALSKQTRWSLHLPVTRHLHPLQGTPLGPQAPPARLRSPHPTLSCEHAPHFDLCRPPRGVASRRIPFIPQRPFEPLNANPLGIKPRSPSNPSTGTPPSFHRPPALPPPLSQAEDPRWRTTPSE